jgi:hypothetical protein
MNALASVAAVLAAYLVGSLSFAVIVSRTMGLADPRSYGSKNPGATNVLRSGNKAAALLTLAFDALKGYVPVWLALAFGARLGLGEWTVAFVGLAAFLGHLWPVFFRFQGGKGVATAAGVLMALTPGLAWPLAELGDHRGLFSLCLAGVDRRRAVRTVLSVADLGRRAGAGLHHADEPAAGLAPRGQHPQAARRHRIQARPEGGSRPGPAAKPAARRHTHRKGHSR